MSLKSSECGNREQSGDITCKKNLCFKARKYFFLKAGKPIDFFRNMSYTHHIKIEQRQMKFAGKSILLAEGATLSGVPGKKGMGTVNG